MFNSQLDALSLYFSNYVPWNTENKTTNLKAITLIINPLTEHRYTPYKIATTEGRILTEECDM
jgi:hypothetical protein